MCLGMTGQVAAVTGDRRALVRAADRLVSVSLLTLDEPIAPGDWVLVHAGFALARLSEDEVADARELRATSEKGWR